MFYFISKEKNHFRSIFGSTKRNPKKCAATAIVKPLPQAPAPTPVIPTGTLIDLQTPPSSPKSQRHHVDSIWSLNRSSKTRYRNPMAWVWGASRKYNTLTGMAKTISGSLFIFVFRENRNLFIALGPYMFFIKFISIILHVRMLSLEGL